MMNNKEINEALARLGSLGLVLDDAFAENGGEVTPELESMLDQQEAIRTLLEGDGIDSLGRWLKSVEDEEAMYKAEKDTIQRRINGRKKLQDYIKEQIRKVMDAIHADECKGSLYRFKSKDTRRVEFDKELVKSLYLDKAMQAIHKAGIPDYISLSLTANSSAIPEGKELPDIFTVNESKTVTFYKPRANKEKKEIDEKYYSGDAVQPE